MLLQRPEDIRADRESKKKERDKKALSVAQQRALIESKLSKLSDKQRKYIELQLTHPEWSARTCAREANYKLTSGSRASGIVKSIQGKLGNVFADCFAYTEYDLCKTIVQAAREAKIVTYTVIRQYKNGVVSTEKIIRNEQPDHKTRLLSAKIIAKLGNYEPAAKFKHEHSGQIGFTAFAEKMSIAEKEREERDLTEEIDANYEVVESVN